ncbi:MAG TPA: SRPBCC domain-containing protein [Candidatus Cybelea sp.]
MRDSDPVVVEIFIDAEAELVFRFLTEPELMRRWMGVEVELDPRPGGIYRVSPEGVEIARGSYVHVVPNRKVAFTWGFENAAMGIPAGSTLVEITLEERPAGTLVRLLHHRLPGEQAKRSHEKGWRHYLSRLKIVAEGGDPGPNTPE